MTNLARFIIDGSVGGVSPASNLGYTGQHGETLTFRLEGTNIPLVRSFEIEVYSPSAEKSPRASKGSPLLTVTGMTSGQSARATSPAGTITTELPVSGVHAWMIRCKVDGGLDANNVEDPNRIFERQLVIRSSAVGLRKMVVTEQTQYESGGWAEAYNELVDAVEGISIGGGSVPVVYKSVGSNTTLVPADYQGGNPSIVTLAVAVTAAAEIKLPSTATSFPPVLGQRIIFFKTTTASPYVLSMTSDDGAVLQDEHLAQVATVASENSAAGFLASYIWTGSYWAAESLQRFPSAGDISIDNTGTSFSSTDVQEFVEEVDVRIGDVEDVLTSAEVVAGDGLTGGGALPGSPTLNVVADADGSISVSADAVKVGVLATDAQHGARGGGTQHAVATGSTAGFMSAAQVTAAEEATAGVAALTARSILAGAGLTGGGTLSADRTLNVVADADGSISVSADAVKVGVLATDAQHGARGGGTQHAVATGSTAGFMSAAQVGALNTAGSDITGLKARNITAGAGLTGGGNLSADRTINVVASDGTIVVDADSIRVGVIPAANLAPNYARKYLSMQSGQSVTLTNSDWPANAADSDLIVQVSYGGVVGQTAAIAVPASPVIGARLYVVSHHVSNHFISIDPRGNSIQNDSVGNAQTAILTIDASSSRWIAAWEFNGTHWLLLTALPYSWLRAASVTSEIIRADGVNPMTGDFNGGAHAVLNVDRFRAEGTFPRYHWYRSDAPADQKVWSMYGSSSGGNLTLATRYDNENFGKTVMEFARGAGIDCTGISIRVPVSMFDKNITDVSSNKMQLQSLAPRDRNGTSSLANGASTTITIAIPTSNNVAFHVTWDLHLGCAGSPSYAQGRYEVTYQRLGSSSALYVAHQDWATDNDRIAGWEVVATTTSGSTFDLVLTNESGASRVCYAHATVREEDLT